MRLEYLMLRDAMTKDAQTEFARARAAAAERLAIAARRRDAEALAAAFTLCDGRHFTTYAALLAFLTEREKIALGRSLGLTESRRVRLCADAVWKAASPSIQTSEAAPAMATCAWCRRSYVRAAGWGIFCSKACGLEEMSA